MKLLLFSLFTNGNENLTNKQLEKILTGAVRTEMACTWKDPQWFSFQRYSDRIWNIALMEKLTTQPRTLRGELKVEKFTKIWRPLLVPELNKEMNMLGSQLVSWSAAY